MRFAKSALGLVLAAAALSGCATGFPAKVSRYSAMPAPAGQSFYVVPADVADSGGLEFSRYAALVAQAMKLQGYAEAPNAQAATMLVRVGYGVDEGKTEIVRDPFARSYYADPFYRGAYDPFFGGYYGRPYYSRYRYHGPRSAFYYGWEDPFWYSPYGGRVDSYTVYKSELDVDIRRQADNQQLFGGKAVARSRTDDLGTLVPNLVEAMFTGFPGRSGETVRITVPPRRN